METGCKTFTYDLLNCHFQKFCMYLIKEHCNEKEAQTLKMRNSLHMRTQNEKNNAVFMLYFFTHGYYRLLDKVLKHFIPILKLRSNLFAYNYFFGLFTWARTLLGNNLQSPKTLFLLFSWCLFVSPPLIWYWVSSYVWKEFAGICHTTLTVLFLCFFFICTYKRSMLKIC